MINFRITCIMAFMSSLWYHFPRSLRNNCNGCTYILLGNFNGCTYVLIMIFLSYCNDLIFTIFCLEHDVITFHFIIVNVLTFVFVRFTCSDCPLRTPIVVCSPDWLPPTHQHTLQMHRRMQPQLSVHIV